MSIYIARCDVGWGVFAGRGHSKNEPILAFGGVIIDFDSSRNKGPDEGNALQIGRDQYVDLYGPGLYVNHSCDPNAGVRSGTLLVALRRIARDEEIRFDYSTTMAENWWTMSCRCLAPTCRGMVRDFRHLQESLRRRYRALGVVHDFALESAMPAE